MDRDASSLPPPAEFIEDRRPQFATEDTVTASFHLRKTPLCPDVHPSAQRTRGRTHVRGARPPTTLPGAASGSAAATGLKGGEARGRKPHNTTQTEPNPSSVFVHLLGPHRAVAKQTKSP